MMGHPARNVNALAWPCLPRREADHKPVVVLLGVLRGCAEVADRCGIDKAP